MERVLRCVRCGKEYDLFSSRYRCVCGGLLEVSIKGSLSPSLKETFRERKLSHAKLDVSNVFRYREFVIDLDEDAVVSIGEGRTTLYKKVVDGMEVFFKHEGENPTGSFKDRGMAVGVSVAKYLGYKFTACASTGNTAASLSSYSAHAGLKSIVFVPRGKVALGKLSQALAYGAYVFEVVGDFDDAMSIVEDVAEQHRVYLLNSLNPLRLEGQKTIIINILEELNWEEPDWIIVPGGNLGNTSAFGKALKELYNFGFIKKVPRIGTIQAEGASPFYKSYITHFKEFEPEKPETIATAIRIGNPVNFEKAKEAITFTNGVVEFVSDSEILQAKSEIDNMGIGCEPASAASLAGFKKLLKKGIIKRTDLVVMILTGHLLKDPDATIKLHTGAFEGVDVRKRFFEIDNATTLKKILGMLI